MSSPQTPVRGVTRTSVDTPASSLEKDLEHIIDAGEKHGKQQPEVAAKRSRKSACNRSSSQPGVTQRDASGAGGVTREVLQESLAQLESAQATASAKQREGASHRERCAEELQHAQHGLRELVAVLEGLEAETPRAEDLACSAEEQLEWLDDIRQHCEKARTKQVFHGAVMEAFCGALARLREADGLQRARMQDAAAEAQRLREECEARRGEQGERQHKAARLQDTARCIESEIQAIQHDLDHAASQIQQVQGMLAQREQIDESAASVARSEVALHEAARQLDAVRSLCNDCAGWSEDLHNFLGGHGARDSTAICRGLQTVLAPGDPLPVIVRALLSETSGPMDPSNSTAVSVRELVTEQLRAARDRLQDDFATRQRAWSEAEERVAEGQQQLRRLEEELRGAFARCGLPGPPALAEQLRRGSAGA